MVLGLSVSVRLFAQKVFVTQRKFSGLPLRARVCVRPSHARGISKIAGLDRIATSRTASTQQV